MNSLDHDGASELIGAYALDALEPQERSAVDDHLAHCVRCRVEVRGYLEVVGLLANSGGDAPGHIWPSIASGIDETGRPAGGPPELRQLFGSSHRVADPRRRLFSGATVLVAAALVLAAVVGAEIARVEDRTGGIAQAASAALSDASARHVQLTATSPSRRVVAEIAVLPGGTAFLVNRGLPALDGSQTYQLWGDEDSTLVSLGLLGNDPTDVAFHVDPGAAVTEFAVTTEHAGGVVRTAHAPVAVSAPG